MDANRSERVTDGSGFLVRHRRAGAGSSALGIVLLLLSIVPAGCTEDTNPVGFDRGSRGSVGAEIETVLVAAPSADAESRPPQTTGASLSLLVGSDDSMRARALIRFESLPDTTGLRYAYLQLHAKRGRGDVVHLEVRPVQGDSVAWSASEVTWDTQPEVNEGTFGTSWPVATGTIGSSDVDTIPQIEIPMSLVRLWKESSERNAGLQISIVEEQDTRGGPGIARIVSHNGLIYDRTGAEIRTPALVFTDSLRVIVGSVEATADAYVYEDWRPEPSGVDSLANVSSGPPARVNLRFDVGALPSYATVVRATLSLPLDAGQLSEDLSARLAVYEITEAWDDSTAVPDSLETATKSTYIETYADSLATAIDMEIGELVQAWSDGEENLGVTIRFADETAAPQGIRLSTREAARKPTLRILYLRPLDFRWESAR